MDRRLFTRGILATISVAAASMTQHAFAKSGNSYAEETWYAFNKGIFEDGIPLRDARCQQLLEAIAAPITATSQRRYLNWRIGLAEDGGEYLACTPGGGVILMGKSIIMDCDNEAELASIIAHEVGHNEHQHFERKGWAAFTGYANRPDIEDMNKNAQDLQAGDFQKITKALLDSGYNQRAEHEADRYILHAFDKTGYSPKYCNSFFNKLLQQGGSSGAPCLFSTHPETQERIRRLDVLARGSRQGQKVNTPLFTELKARLQRL